jgi:hypothetical protein
MHQTALYCTVLQCHIYTNITITFTFQNKFLLYPKNTKVWYSVLISFFMKKKNFCIYKTNYIIFEFIILLTNTLYIPVEPIILMFSAVQCSAVNCIAA